MDLDDKLAHAFATWSDARAQLGKLRARTASGPTGKQLAPTPEALALFESIQQQEATCMRLWHELATVAEERSAALELTRTHEMKVRAQASVADARGGSPPASVPPPPLQAPDREQP